MVGSNHKVSIVVGVQDLATRSLRGIQTTLNGMGKGLGNANGVMSSFHRNLDSVISKMDRLATSMYKFNMYTSSLQRNLRNISLIGGVAATGVALQGTNNALEYDYKTRIMQSRMETGDTGRKKVSDYILNDLNYKVSYTPTQLADMGIVLGQGGINNPNDMNALLKTVSYFSEAVDAVPEQAAEMVISAAKGFGISMENSSQITDKLTIALNKSLLHTEELPHAIGQLAGRANMFGQSFDSSLVALMTMRDQGMSAAQGSQDLLHALRQGSRIGNDSVLYKRTRGYFEELGVTNAIFNKDSRQLKEYPELIADMEKAMIKQGFINPKYKKEVTDLKSFHGFVDKNGGAAPKDFWDSEKAMPLITRVFGAAGQAPILMGLQTKYEEVNKETGDKTGKIFYGSEALKQMYKDVKNSDGAVDQTHNIMQQSGKFQLEVLSGAWQAAQIKFLDGIVPLIKTGAESLTSFLNPKKSKEGITDKNGNRPIADNQSYNDLSALDKFRISLGETTDTFRKNGHKGTAEVIDTLGNGVIDGVQISSVVPSITKQIGEAFNKDMVKADWGSSLIEFPWHIVKNGIKFISDIFKANEEFDAAVSKLPTDLQDPARLIETLVKGGLALMITGAVVKTIELGIRGVSTALKVAKTGTKLTESIISMMMGKGGKGGPLSEIMGKNMNVKANIVNVYGGTVNGGAGGKGTKPGGSTVVGGGPGGGPAKSFGSKALNMLKWGGYAALLSGALYVITHPKETSQMVQHNKLQKGVEKGADKIRQLTGYNNIGVTGTDKKIDEIHKLIKNPSTFTGPRNTELKAPPVNPFVPTKVKSEPLAPAMNTQALANIKFPAIERMNANFDAWMSRTMPKNIAGTQTEKNNNETILNYSKQLSQDAQNSSSILNNTILGSFNAANGVMQEGASAMNSSIVNGFNTANSAIQNLKLNNAVSVMVQPPQVHVTGVPQAKVTTSGSTSFTQRESQGGSAWERKNQIMGRRLGWR